MMRSRTEVTAYAGIAASVAAVGLVLAAPWAWVALIGTGLLACVPGGAAVMCRLDSGDALAQAGLTLVLSLATFALASTAMIWAAWWHPRALLALAAVGAASCAARLAREAGR